METKEFSTAALASLSTGILLCNFSEVHEAAAFLMGHPIWTHHFGNRDFSEKLKSSVLRQFPDLPEYLEGVTRENVQDKILEIEVAHGKTKSVSKGTGETQISPFEEFPK